MLQAIEDLDAGRGYFKAWAAPAEAEAEVAETETELLEGVKEAEEQVGESLEARVAEPVAA